MNDFKKNNRFGGNERRGNDFGKRDFNRPSFGGNKSGPPGKNFGRTFELFQATCASCGKSCEVPFKPNGKKPVYCKECFAANGGPAASSHVPSDRFAPKRDFERPSAPRQEYRPSNDKVMPELAQQIAAIGAKLDKILNLLADQAHASKAEHVPVASEAPVTKEPAKKSAAKKKK